jgi:hypothetical protein
VKSDREFLKHILDEIHFVKQKTKGLAFEGFIKKGCLTLKIKLKKFLKRLMKVEKQNELLSF